MTELIHDYDQKLNQVVASFVTEELRPYFSQLFDFLVMHELGNPDKDPAAMISIIADFNAELVNRVKIINSAVIQDFSDHRTAVFVVNVIFTQLLTAYQQFLEIHDSLIGKSPSADSIIPTSPMQVEQILRQFHPSFNPPRRK